MKIKKKSNVHKLSPVSPLWFCRKCKKTKQNIYMQTLLFKANKSVYKMHTFVKT